MFDMNYKAKVGGYSRPWTPEMNIELKALWEDGKTGGEIAKILNDKYKTSFSRSAIISRTRKIGVSRRRFGPLPKKVPISLSDKRKKAIDSDESRTDLKDLLDLKPNECRWPVFDPKDPRFGFCGHPVASGKSYCAPHAERAYSPVATAYGEKKPDDNN